MRTDNFSYIKENQSKSPLERGTALACNKEINACHNSFVENEGRCSHIIILYYSLLGFFFVIPMV